VIRFLTNFFFEFTGVPFGLLDFKRAMIFYKTWNYIPLVILFGTYILLCHTRKTFENRMKVY